MPTPKSKRRISNLLSQLQDFSLDDPEEVPLSASSSIQETKGLKESNSNDWLASDASGQDALNALLSKSNKRKVKVSIGCFLSDSL